MSGFHEILQLESLHAFLAEAGLAEPHAVQKATIPRLLAGESVNVLAPTSSGKTLAYALPIAQAIKAGELGADANGEAAAPVGAPRAWILVPTAELMEQVATVFRELAHRVKLRVRVDRPGSQARQTKARLAGPVDILVTSAARALRALERGTLRADRARFLICDEADQLLDRDFFTHVAAVYARLRSPQLQIGLFSATMPSWFEARRDEAFPGVSFASVVLQGAHRLHDNIATHNRTVPFTHKPQIATDLLTREHTPGFVFVNQRTTALTLREHLGQALPDKRVGLLHGGMPKPARRAALRDFVASGDVLVCTDVAARGLDLPNVDWVLNYDMPFDPVYYMHRCGRVGRRGDPARVLNLVTDKDRPLLTRINTAIANQASLKLSRVVHQASTEDTAKRKRKPPRRDQPTNTQRSRAAAKPGTKKQSAPRPAARATFEGQPGRGPRGPQAPRPKWTPRPPGAAPTDSTKSGRRPSGDARSGSGRPGNAKSAARPPRGAKPRGPRQGGRPSRGAKPGRPTRRTRG